MSGGEENGALLDLPKIRQAIKEGRPIVLATDSKVARQLQALGHAATSNHGGTLRFEQRHAQQLRGADVVMALGNDNESRLFGRRIPQLLYAAGVNCVLRLQIPGLPEGWSLGEWLRNYPGSEEEKRDKLERLMGAAPAVPQPVYEKSAMAGTRSWKAARDVHDFVSANEPDTDFLVPGMIARGAVTGWYSPRGLGKTLVAHAIAVRLARHGLRVLLVDRDNAPREVRRRLLAWGLDDVKTELLKVITRDEAPPLTDTAAWRQFPVAEYDLVILDSFDSAAEGVGEQDSARSSAAVAALLDVVRGTVGPAALVLGNTIKSGSHGRGSGVIEDRIDIVFEVRDATGLQPSGTKDWWLELPPSGRDAWAQRASRRKKRDSYRLAFVPSKFRVGEEPEPSAFEISCATLPWKCSDVTAELVRQGEQARTEAEHAGEALLANAAEKLATEVRSRGSMLKRDEAEPFLVEQGLTRDEARNLINRHTGVLWRLNGAGTKGDPVTLLPLESECGLAGIEPSDESRQARLDASPILADTMDSGPPESNGSRSAPDADDGTARFRRDLTRGDGHPHARDAARRCSGGATASRAVHHRMAQVGHA